MSENLAIGIIWAGLLLAPPIALITIVVLPTNVRFTAIRASIAFLIFLFAFQWFGFSFTSTAVSAGSVTLAYASYCVLVAGAWRVSDNNFRLVVGIAGLLPIGLGYAMSTIGLLGLMFIVSDSYRVPKETKQISKHLTCRWSYWGMVASDSGYKVQLIKSWPTFPIVERRVASESICETCGDERGATCDSVYQTYAKSEPSK
jgi:hypothetical protein